MKSLTQRNVRGAMPAVVANTQSASTTSTNVVRASVFHGHYPKV